MKTAKTLLSAVAFLGAVSLAGAATHADLMKTVAT